jgi:cellulose synthase/poly-beta-1,6-N-acetylglucosamine synthase-like glycosyltransferase
MKSSLSTIASVLLLFNGFSALYGGWNLIAHPDGSSLGMEVSLLSHSPFHDFLIPGIILFICNGIGSLAAFTGILLRPRKLAWLVWAQGLVLLVWLFVQLIMIETLHPLQFILGTVGVALIWLGRNIADKNNR